MFSEFSAACFRSLPNEFHGIRNTFLSDAVKPLRYLQQRYRQVNRDSHIRSQVCLPLVCWVAYGSLPSPFGSLREERSRFTKCTGILWRVCLKSV